MENNLLSFLLIEQNFGVLIKSKIIISKEFPTFGAINASKKTYNLKLPTKNMHHGFEKLIFLRITLELLTT